MQKQQQKNGEKEYGGEKSFDSGGKDQPLVRRAIPSVEERDIEQCHHERVSFGHRRNEVVGEKGDEKIDIVPPYFRMVENGSFGSVAVPLKGGYEIPRE
jgi:hypothetical protein